MVAEKRLKGNGRSLIFLPFDVCCKLKVILISSLKTPTWAQWRTGCNIERNITRNAISRDLAARCKISRAKLLLRQAAVKMRCLQIRNKNWGTSLDEDLRVLK